MLEEEDEGGGNVQGFAGDMRVCVGTDCKKYKNNVRRNL